MDMYIKCETLVETKVYGAVSVGLVLDLLQQYKLYKYNTIQIQTKRPHTHSCSQPN